MKRLRPLGQARCDFGQVVDSKSIESRLKSLATAADTGGFFNLHWLGFAVELVIACQSEVEQLIYITDIRGLDEKDHKWLSLFLSNNAKFLQVCNLVKQGIAKARCSSMIIKYVLHLLEPGTLTDESRLVKVKKALDECFAQVNQKQDEEVCGSRQVFEDPKAGSKQVQHQNHRLRQQQQQQQQRRCWILEEELLELQPRGALKKSRIPGKVYEADLITALVLSALLAALPCSKASSNLLPSLSVSIDAPWAASLSRLKQGLDEEAGRCCRTNNRTNNNNNGGLLAGVYTGLRQIDSLVRSCGDPANEERDSRLKQLVQQTNKKLEYFEDGMQQLEQQVACLFEKLMSSRNHVLLALS